MAILSANLDYTDKDFDSLRTRLFALVASVFPTWTNTQIANFANLLVELYCFVGDVLGKYQDNQARESRWSQATQRKNLIALASLIGYEPTTATASQVGVDLSIPAPVAGDVVIQAGSVCRTKEVADPVIFRLLTDATILAGTTDISATAENSEPQQDVFASPKAANLELVLGSTPYLDGSASVTAAEGVFTEVDNFLNSTSTDLHYTVTVDQNDRATIRFGNGTNGVIPTGTITVDYKTGGGAAGVVEAGTVEVIDGVFTDEFGTPVTVSVINPSASTPATDRETREQIRQNAPLSLRVLNRTVSREDYEINALRLADVARALMLTSNENPAIQENQGTLFIVPVGGGEPTEDLKERVLEQVTVVYPNTLTFVVTVSTALYKTIDIDATVYLEKGANPATVKAEILSNLETFFAIMNDDGTVNERIGFGYQYVENEGDPTGILPYSDIYNVFTDTSGIRRVSSTQFTLNDIHGDVEILLREFPILGTVRVVDGDTLQEL